MYLSQVLTICLQTDRDAGDGVVLRHRCLGCGCLDGPVIVPVRKELRGRSVSLWWLIIYKYLAL